MGFFGDLFRKKVTSHEMKAALTGLESERKKKNLEFARLSATRERLLEELKIARKDGRNFEVDYLYADYKSVGADVAMLGRDIRKINLEGLALKRYIRCFERLERLKDRKGIESLLSRIGKSKLDEILVGNDIDEAAYMERLNEVVAEEASPLGRAEERDPEKEKFLAELDGINAMENKGDYDKAKERQTELRREDEKEGGPMAV